MIAIISVVAVLGLGVFCVVAWVVTQLINEGLRLLGHLLSDLSMMKIKQSRIDRNLKSLNDLALQAAASIRLHEVKKAELTEEKKEEDEEDQEDREPGRPRSVH